MCRGGIRFTRCARPLPLAGAACTSHCLHSDSDLLSTKRSDGSSKKTEGSSSSSKDTTPRDSNDDATPRDSNDDATPRDSSKDTSPRDSSQDTTPRNSNDDATPRDSNNDTTRRRRSEDLTPCADTTPRDSNNDTTRRRRSEELTPREDNTPRTPRSPLNITPRRVSFKSVSFFSYDPNDTSGPVDPLHVQKRQPLVDDQSAPIPEFTFPQGPSLTLGTNSDLVSPGDTPREASSDFPPRAEGNATLGSPEGSGRLMPSKQAFRRVSIMEPELHRENTQEMVASMTTFVSEFQAPSQPNSAQVSVAVLYLRTRGALQGATMLFPSRGLQCCVKCRGTV